MACKPSDGSWINNDIMTLVPVCVCVCVCVCVHDVCLCAFSTPDGGRFSPGFLSLPIFQMSDIWFAYEKLRKHRCFISLTLFLFGSFPGFSGFSAQNFGMYAWRIFWLLSAWTSFKRGFWEKSLDRVVDPFIYHTILQNHLRTENLRQTRTTAEWKVDFSSWWWSGFLSIRQLIVI